VNDRNEMAESSRASLGARFLYKVIKNDAMKQDPPEIYGWRTFMMACSACFGGMLFGFDIGTIGGVLTLPAFQQYVSPYMDIMGSNRSTFY
jgi:hypothetical protein